MDKTFGNRNFIGEVIFLTEEQGGRRTNPHTLIYIEYKRRSLPGQSPGTLCTNTFLEPL